MQQVQLFLVVPNKTFFLLAVDDKPLESSLHCMGGLFAAVEKLAATIASYEAHRSPYASVPARNYTHSVNACIHI